MAESTKIAKHEIRFQNDVKKAVEQYRKGIESSVSENHLKIFKWIFDEYKMAKRSHKNSIKSTQIRKKYSEIVKTSEKLKKCFEGLSDFEGQWIGNRDNLSQGDYMLWLPDNDNSGEVNFIIETLKNIIFRSNRIVGFFSRTQSGKREDVALRILIQRMAYFYEKITDKKPVITYDPNNDLYKGSFLEIIYGVLIELQEQPHSKNSLGKKIQRSLKQPTVLSFMNLENMPIID